MSPMRAEDGLDAHRTASPLLDLYDLPGAKAELPHITASPLAKGLESLREKAMAMSPLETPPTAVSPLATELDSLQKSDEPSAPSNLMMDLHRLEAQTELERRKEAVRQQAIALRPMEPPAEVAGPAPLVDLHDLPDAFGVDKPASSASADGSGANGAFGSPEPAASSGGTPTFDFFEFGAGATPPEAQWLTHGDSAFTPPPSAGE